MLSYHSKFAVNKSSERRGKEQSRVNDLRERYDCTISRSDDCISRHRDAIAREVVDDLLDRDMHMMKRACSMLAYHQN